MSITTCSKGGETGGGPPLFSPKWALILVSDPSHPRFILLHDPRCHHSGPFLAPYAGLLPRIAERFNACPFRFCIKLGYIPVSTSVKPQSTVKEITYLRRWPYCQQEISRRFWISLSNISPAISFWFYSLCPAFLSLVVLCCKFTIHLLVGCNSVFSALFETSRELCSLSSCVFENFCCFYLWRTILLSLKFLDLILFPWGLCSTVFQC